jgi:flagellar basal body L-ring protein FlgH
MKVKGDYQAGWKGRENGITEYTVGQYDQSTLYVLMKPLNMYDLIYVNKKENKQRNKNNFLLLLVLK